jgi:hypothetical protein
MNSEGHSDFLIMVIFLLGSICFTRWLYLEESVTPIADNLPVHSDRWTPPP